MRRARSADIILKATSFSSTHLLRANASRAADAWSTSFKRRTIRTENCLSSDRRLSPYRAGAERSLFQRLRTARGERRFGLPVAQAAGECGSMNINKVQPALALRLLINDRSLSGSRETPGFTPGRLSMRSRGRTRTQRADVGRTVGPRRSGPINSMKYLNKIQSNGALAGIEFR